jgi:hypothetical protein
LLPDQVFKELHVTLYFIVRVRLAGGVNCPYFDRRAVFTN